MRGIVFDEPMTLRDLAEACKLSVGYLREFVRDGYLRPVKSDKKRPMSVVGYVPITRDEWQARLLSVVPTERQHMVGVDVNGDFVVLVGTELRRQIFDGRIHVVEEQGARIKKWTSSKVAE